ncbi:hypothetical protein [Terrabacter sp. BE26]|uniref:hypothetical protein n=1 Tax=Terrabacter sp. BE26 TaxID=2898152 RepID=UPI0035BE8FCD
MAVARSSGARGASRAPAIATHHATAAPPQASNERATTSWGCAGTCVDAAKANTNIQAPGAPIAAASQAQVAAAAAAATASAHHQRSSTMPPALPSATAATNPAPTAARVRARSR